MKYLIAFFSVVYSLIGQAQDRVPEARVPVRSSEKEAGARENDRRSDKNNSRTEFERLNKIKNVESVRALNCGLGGSTLSR